METVNYDCRFFRGYIPCAPHKREGVHCLDCAHYDQVKGEILIIKLGATGDVIRTTPLLRRLRADFPHSRIWWITESPDVIPSLVDVVLPWTLGSTTLLRGLRFDLVYSLDKDPHACALATELWAETVKGFVISNNAVTPADDDAQQKFLTGLFDDLSKANTKSYPQELFELCGFPFQGERYVVDVDPDATRAWELDRSRPIIGLNTGSGDRWTSRQWSEGQWEELTRSLIEAGREVVLLGGPAEHERNTVLAKATGARYFGTMPLPKFATLVNACDVVVTGVTMALHLAIGCERRIVLLNNIFNRHEFDLYGLGEIIEPARPCQCYFRPVCVNPEYRCLDHLSPESVRAACERQLTLR
jgi:ADP-heptose:LPS heptosyltransferase